MKPYINETANPPIGYNKLYVIYKLNEINGDFKYSLYKITKDKSKVPDYDMFSNKIYICYRMYYKGKYIYLTDGYEITLKNFIKNLDRILNVNKRDIVNKGELNV